MAERKKEVLRPKWDSRKQMWKIVKKTYGGSGGGARVGKNFYLGKEETEKTIDMIVRNQPEMYENEV